MFILAGRLTELIACSTFTALFLPALSEPKNEADVHSQAHPILFHCSLLPKNQRTKLTVHLKMHFGVVEFLPTTMMIKEQSSNL